MRRKLLALFLVLCLMLPLIPAVTLDVASAETTKTYRLVTSVEELQDGCIYLLVNTDEAGVGKALSKQNTINRSAVDVTITTDRTIVLTEDQIAFYNNEDKVFQLTLGGSTGEWSFYIESAGYLYNPPSNNQLKTQGKNDDNSKFTISFENHDVNIISSDDRYLCYDEDSNVYSCYDDDNIDDKDSSLCLYRYDADAGIDDPPVTPSPTAEPTATPEPSPTAEPEVYTVLFEANGGTGEMPSVEINPEEKYELPTCAFTAPEGKDFWGWMATDDGSGRVFFPGETIYVEKNTVFDAQWVTGYVDELTRETTGVDKNSASYVEWAGKNGKKTAIYAGQSAGKDDSVQIKAENLSGIVTTTSGGKARKIAVVWNENTYFGSVLDIYGKNTPYTSAAELYGLNQGTKLGSIIYGTGTSIDISGEYKYIGLRSNSGAIQLDSIRINWEETAPTFITQSLVLSGEIGVNFYMDLSMLNPDELSQCYMTFTVGMGSKIKTPKAEFKEDLKSKDGEYYGFTCYVNAIQMADPIKATFHYPTGDGEKTVKRGDYSVRLYVVGANDLDETTVALARALINYGHFVQLYLSELRHWTIDTDYAEIKLIEGTEVSYSTEQVKEEVADYAIQREHSNQDIAAITFSLVLDSETAIRVYFRPSENYTGGLTATVDGKTTEIKSLSDGRFLLEIPNIAAHELGKHFAIVAKTVNGTANVNVSALSYVQSMLNKDDANTDAKNAVYAIYDYYKAAQAFIAAHQQ